MIDDGKEDIKIIAIPFKDPMWNSFEDIRDLPMHIVDEIKHFFGVYKQLEGKKMDVLEMSNKEVAMETIRQSIEAYNDIFVNQE